LCHTRSLLVRSNGLHNGYAIILGGLPADMLP